MKYDFVVVGAGLFGSVFAREATDRGRKVLVIEKSQHVGGMCRTELRDGVLVHVFGPHVFHTNDERIWSWVNRFATFRQFMVRTKAISRGRVYTLPINLMTLGQLWEGVVTPADGEAALASRRVPIEHPQTVEELALARWGREIYEKFIYHYTKKQWGREPSKLPASILNRLPARMTYDDNYFQDRFQGVPYGGYSEMFDQMLAGVEVKLGVDFFEDRRSLSRLGQLIYSGRVDRYFEYEFGPLEFRSCRFETKTLDGDFQGNPVIHWVDPDVAHTRSVEHKHFSAISVSKTVVTWEFPFECDQKSMPLYPINDAKNNALFDKYMTLRSATVFGGRLGSYRYRDMHQVVAEAISLAERLT